MKRGEGAENAGLKRFRWGLLKLLRTKTVFTILEGFCAVKIIEINTKERIVKTTAYGFGQFDSVLFHFRRVKRKQFFLIERVKTAVEIDCKNSFSGATGTIFFSGRRYSEFHY